MPLSEINSLSLFASAVSNSTKLLQVKLPFNVCSRASQHNYFKRRALDKVSIPFSHKNMKHFI